MSIVQDILIDEKKRLEILLNKYYDELKVSPKGSLSRKKRGNSFYIYLAYRKGKRVIFKYIGKDDSKPVKELHQRIKKRNVLESKIKKVESDLKEIRRGLRGKK